MNVLNDFTIIIKPSHSIKVSLNEAMQYCIWKSTKTILVKLTAQENYLTFG